MSLVVRLSVACITRKPQAELHPIFLCMLHMALAICYVFPVLWMTSGFHITVLWRITCIPKQRQKTTSITAEIPTKFCLTTKTRSTHCCETPKAPRGVGNGRGCRKLSQRWLNLVKSECQRSHLVTRISLQKQETQLSPSDRAMRLVSSNLANYHSSQD